MVVLISQSLDERFGEGNSSWDTNRLSNLLFDLLLREKRLQAIKEKPSLASSSFCWPFLFLFPFGQQEDDSSQWWESRERSRSSFFFSSFSCKRTIRWKKKWWSNDLSVPGFVSFSWAWGPTDRARADARLKARSGEGNPLMARSTSSSTSWKRKEVCARGWSPSMESSQGLTPSHTAKRKKENACVITCLNVFFFFYMPCGRRRLREDS